MRTFLALIPTAALMVACGGNKADTTQKPNDSLPTTVVDSPKVDLPDTVSYTAFGKGWKLQLIGNNAKIVTATGDSSIGEYAAAPSVNATTKQSETLYRVGKEFAFTTTEKPTKGDDGKTYSDAVTVSYKGKTYKGAGGKVVPMETTAKPEEKPAEKPVAQRTTVNGKWVLETLNGKTAGKKAFTNGMAYININTVDSSVKGFGGCNNLSGVFTLTQGRTIKIDRIITTKMFCEGVPENDFLAALRAATTFAIVDYKLQLIADGKVLATFVRE